ncbi:MAG: heme ABC exporter ATP-binding protein CcmA [Chloroflexi bacterium]|nr:heme ABC exporter ATP-binding protein CcmA [Chloroflexota bacterium]
MAEPFSTVWAVETQDVTKVFGNHLALRGVNLKVAGGESVVLYGPNGAGKTTLLRVLSTIMKPTSGNILIDGLNLKDHAEALQRRMGIVSHHTFLYNSLTAFENLDFYSRMYDVPDARERIREVVDMVGMTARLHDRVGILSRGMQQRLSIARALLHKPSLMLLDEPETGLDQQAISMLWEALKSEGQGKRTVIFTTHTLERGLELGERLLILDRGKIVHESATKDMDLACLKETYRRATGVGV